jgi:ligand-binding SRPBCC domain-containing protein
MPAALTRRQYQVFIDRPPEAVFAFHTSLKNHQRISPPDQPEEVLSPLDTVLDQGVRITTRTKRGGVWQTLEAEIVEWDPPNGFTDRQVSGPFASWTHRHKFVPFQAGTLMTDTIEYSAPAGPLGALADKLWLGKHLDEFFRFRQAEAKRILEQVGRIKGRGL